MQSLAISALEAGLLTAAESSVGMDTGSQPAALVGLTAACAWTWLTAEDPSSPQLTEMMSWDTRLLRKLQLKANKLRSFQIRDGVLREQRAARGVYKEYAKDLSEFE
eukprot:CAMPEP_0183334982 /NCGR_PEP_ID=MMETSP0164_2-20130417/3413_1 /TAXON_ID=221442 /ORGANISM="Coccolithus pelagicus ssp braarudi, Strain PLY182g" /LENGTH=106 /DNA_ID=CAMNT_0025504231 /DNA_START=99 /DNA_END=419 /DNA_ORIENTATION=+